METISGSQAAPKQYRLRKRASIALGVLTFIMLFMSLVAENGDIKAMATFLGLLFGGSAVIVWWTIPSLDNDKPLPEGTLGYATMDEFVEFICLDVKEKPIVLLAIPAGELKVMLLKQIERLSNEFSKKTHKVFAGNRERAIVKAADRLERERFRAKTGS